MTEYALRPTSELPMIDEGRGRLRLDAAQLAALSSAAWEQEPGDEATRAAVGQLRTSGILDDELRLHPLAADLARCSAVPLLRVVVEVRAPQGVTEAHVVVAGETTWSSEPWPGDPDGPVVYQRGELPTLLWDLARLAGLHRAKPPADAVACEVPAGMLENVVETAVTTGDWDDLRTVVLARSRELWPEVPDDQRVRALALVASLRSTWRLTCGWGGPDGSVRALTVFDCGDEGYWRQTAPAEPVLVAPAPGDTVRLEPVTGGQLWDALAGLLPSGAELRAANGAA